MLGTYPTIPPSNPYQTTSEEMTMKIKQLMGAVLAMVLIFTACSNDEKAVKLDEKFLENAHTAVKEAFGENYIPSMAFDETMLSDIYGVAKEDVDAFIAEGPMISVHVDTFIGIRVKEGKEEAVAAALEAYRKKLIEENMQYPMNMAKVNASKVYTIGNHVFFLMLGKINDGGEQTEEDALNYEKEQVQIAVDAIEGLVK